jgi:hypothetical protein
VNLEIQNNKIDVVTVYDGKKMWVSTMGKTMEIKDERILKETREELQTELAGDFIEFLDKPYELSAIGEVKVKNKDAVGIRVSKKGQRDMSFFFDKQANLLVKIETRTNDLQSGQEVTQEKFIVGYQDQNGLKVARRVQIHKDGKASWTWRSPNCRFWRSSMTAFS